MIKGFSLVFLLNSFFLLFFSVASHTVFSQQAELKSIDNKTFKKLLLDLNDVKDKNNVLVTLQKLLLTKNLTKKQRIKVLLRKGETLLFLSRFEDAVNILIEAKKEVDGGTEKLTDIKINSLLGVGYYYLGELALSLSSYQYALGFYKKGEGIGTEDRETSIKKSESFE